MEPGVKDRGIMYRLIIGQLYHDGHNQLALDLSNSIGMNPSLLPSDKLFRLVSDAWLVEDDSDEEEKGNVQMSSNQVVSSIDNLSINEEHRDYFPFLALPPELQALVFSYLSIEDRMRARVTKSLVEVEAKKKYHVDSLFIGEKCCIRAPCPFRIEARDTQKIVFLESKSYSSDSIRRIAHNVSVRRLRIELSGSSEFHREVYNLIKEINIGHLILFFESDDLEKEVMVESFVVDLARSCKILQIQSDYITPENLHGVYKMLLDGSTKLRSFYCIIVKQKCISFLHLIGIAYRDGSFFSNRNIEVFEHVENLHIFDGQLEIILYDGIFDDDDDEGEFHLIHHETLESLEGTKNEEGMDRVEIGPE